LRALPLPAVREPEGTTARARFVRPFPDWPFLLAAGAGLAPWGDFGLRDSCEARGATLCVLGTGAAGAGAVFWLPVDAMGPPTVACGEGGGLPPCRAGCDPGWEPRRARRAVWANLLACMNPGWWKPPDSDSRLPGIPRQVAAIPVASEGNVSIPGINGFGKVGPWHATRSSGSATRSSFRAVF